MNRHDLLHIHPAKTSWQGIMAHALDAIYAAESDQNDGSTHRLCCPLRKKCLPPDHHAPHPADGRAGPRNGAGP